MLIQRIDIIIGVKSRREKVLLLEGRNEKCVAASLDARGGEGGQQINFDRPLFLLHPSSALERDESSNK